MRLLRRRLLGEVIGGKRSFKCFFGCSVVVLFDVIIFFLFSKYVMLCVNIVVLL